MGGGIGRVVKSLLYANLMWQIYILILDDLGMWVVALGRVN